MAFKYNSVELENIENRGKLIQFLNCRVFRNDQIKFDHLWVRDGRIVDETVLFFDEGKEADIQVDCCGLILSPGFIDLQLNGGFGIDFSTYTTNYADDVSKVAKNLLAHGVTSFAPTIITSTSDVYHKVLPLLKKSNGCAENGAGIVGAHLEGPFISAEKRGCHPKNFVISSFGENVEETIKNTYSSFENIAIVTLAPELEGSDKAIEYLTNQEITVSVGHSSANLEHGENAINHGAKMITHLFNAMQAYHHRDPGLIGLLTSENGRKVSYGIISDGIHTHDSALRIAHRTNADGMILVTDAIAALGMSDGIHKLGSQTINVNGLHAILQGTNTTAGSVANMPFCIRHLIKTTHCSVEYALKCATEKPAQLIGIQNEKGVLSVGNLADIVLLDENIEVKATFCAGQRVFNGNL
ncbi:unnamed protein product [Caenorhabditis angaria]|uniref:N-acetylglucosamine-6-phosphate deacetylase n=1 Tax=Caenorhabditis angaria TaxID=860376 RepID=A0A9P1IIS5_9PELO|nr:unnamed protein product [Caenorhabditis angaria]